MALLVMGALYLIMAAAIVDRLQRLGKMPGALLQVVPGWAGWYSYWESFPWLHLGKRAQEPPFKC